MSTLARIFGSVSPEGFSRPWKLTAPRMSESARARSSAHRPPKQKPMVAMRRASTMGMALAVVVEREAGVSLPGEPARLALHELVATAPGVVDQDRRSRTLLRFVVAEEPLQQGFAIAVFNVLLAHRHSLDPAFHGPVSRSS